MSTAEHIENRSDTDAQRIQEYAETVKAMTREELVEELDILKENLEDTQIEMRLILGQTGVHMGAGQVDAYRDSFNRELTHTEAKIRLVKSALEG